MSGLRSGGSLGPLEVFCKRFSFFVGAFFHAAWRESPLLFLGLPAGHPVGAGVQGFIF